MLTPGSVAESRYRTAMSLLRTVDPRLQAQHSFESYHAPGLRYLNLRRDPQMTAKLYVFEPGRWSPAAGHFVVHPHDHAYAFDTLVLAGFVINHLFTEDEGARNARWKFTPRVGFSDPSAVNLRELSADVFVTGERYAMQPEEIHTIRVNPCIPTLLFLVQGPTVAPDTSCYLPNEEEPPTLDGLYRPMTTERYAETLETALKMIRLPL